MVDVIAAVTGAIGLTKQLLELTTVAKDAKAKLVIADLQIQLAELKTKLAELIDENAQLKQEIKKATSIVAEVTLKDGLYYKADGDGPFCTACYDSKKQLIRVTELASVFQQIGRWRCNVCTAKYGGRQ